MSLRTIAKRQWYRFLQIFLRIFTTATFNMRCTGREVVPETGGGLVLVNHQSMLDPLLVGMACDRRMNFLARKSLFRFWPFRLLIQSLDAIELDLDGTGISGLKETLRRLKREELVLIFPEGSRSFDGKLLPLMPGFCSVARRGKVPLVIIAIAGAHNCLPRGSIIPGWSVVHIHFGQTITPEEIAQIDDPALMKLVSLRLQNALDIANWHREHRLHFPRFLVERSMPTT